MEKDMEHILWKINSRLRRIEIAISGDKDFNTEGIIHKVLNTEKDLDIHIKKYESDRNRIIGGTLTASAIVGFFSGLIHKIWSNG